MKFFISYSRSVKQDVNEVIRLLRAAGHEAWWDADIPTIEDWWATILKNIEWSEIVIFMVSQKAVESAYCMAELHYAIARNRPILPFILDDHTQYTIPSELGRRQYFVHNGDSARMLAQIMQDCKQIDLSKYPDTRSPRPVEPNTGASTVAKQFQQAVNVAESGHFDEAIKRFRNVSSLDYQEWGDECQQWVAKLQLYGEIADLADHKSTHKRAKRKWNEYYQNFGNDFDPLNISGKILNSIVPVISEAASLLVQSQMPASDPPQKSSPKERLARLNSLRAGILTTNIQKPISQSIPTQALRSKVPDILADGLFAWVDIPAGPVTLIENHDDNSYLGKKGESKTFDVPAFAIAKYPVTNAQYAKFIEAAGYNEKKWWTPDGWKQRETEKWIEPRFWQQNSWNQVEHPVVGVSWYEAAAFCMWLRETSGENVALPTEQQWQRAAQAKPDGGDSGWAYPWGNNWEVGRCNNSVSPENSKATTPVTRYVGKGESLCGVVDLSGNVGEWCLTQYNSGTEDINGTDMRVLRVASWRGVITDQFWVGFRDRLNPHGRSDNRGFRISRSS